MGTAINVRAVGWKLPLSLGFGRAARLIITDVNSVFRIWQIATGGDVVHLVVSARRLALLILIQDVLCHDELL